MSQSSSPHTTTPTGDVRQPLSPMESVSEPHGSTPVGPRELQIPEFAKSLTQPLTLKEDLTKLPRKNLPVSKFLIPSSFEEDFHSTNSSMHIDGVSYTVRNISPRFTDNSLAKFLGTQDVGFFRFKILSVNEQKGRFEPPLVPQQIVTIPGMAIVKTRANVTHMLAYAQKSEFEPFESISAMHAFVMKTIFTNFSSKYMAAGPDQPTASCSGPKFGGGLGRKAAGSQPARYMVRTRVGLLSDEEWKQRGATAVDSDSQWTVAKFPRIEVRDAACDSFIVGVEIGNKTSKRFEIGLSEINHEMVFIENMEQPSEGVPPFRQMSSDVFFLTNA
jgi:hypothetical protein